MEIRPRETVILATDFSALVARSGFRIGISDAEEMGVVPADRSCNTVILQFEVDDIQEFFEHLKPTGASITNGPSFDKKGKFWFGGFLNPEGNPCWVVDKNCP